METVPGPHARIVGIDLKAECKEFAEDQIDIRIGDQSDKSFLLDVCKEFGAPDVVLDDGSHMMSHIHATFSVLYPQVPRNGVYIVEDLHTAYWAEFEGGLRRKESFIETCKDLIDELNADNTRDALAATEFSRTTLSMHFYDSLVIFEKGRYGTKSAPQIGHTPANAAGSVAEIYSARNAVTDWGQLPAEHEVCRHAAQARTAVGIRCVFSEHG